ncbi:MAG TPA: DinB family protein [Blastocatellia bacterium]|nr:DinB family protein [Blastocatellia bacterium]
MSEIRRIRSQLRRAFEGEAWHGPSVLELLKDVSAQQAAAHPIAGAHSIWELALHIATWEQFVRRRIVEATALEPTDEENFPTVADTSDAAWRATIDAIKNSHTALLETVAGLDEARLSEIVPGKPYSVYFMLHGVIQHDLYHAGQIALLKKAALT